MEREDNKQTFFLRHDTQACHTLLEAISGTPESLFVALRAMTELSAEDDIDTLDEMSHNGSNREIDRCHGSYARRRLGKSEHPSCSAPYHRVVTVYQTVISWWAEIASPNLLSDPIRHTPLPQIIVDKGCIAPFIGRRSQLADHPSRYWRNYQWNRGDICTLRRLLNCVTMGYRGVML